MNKVAILVCVFLAGCSALLVQPLIFPGDTVDSRITPKAAAVPAIPGSVSPVLVLPSIEEPVVIRQFESSYANKTTKVIPKKDHTIVIDDIMSQLKVAAMTFTVPLNANVKDSLRAELTIDPSKTVEELVKKIGPAVASGTVMISRIVEVKINAPDFKIIELTPSRQAIAQTLPTLWQWELTDANPGQHEIYLTINAVVTVDGTKVERLITTLKKTIVIDITTEQRLIDLIKQYWQWLWTTLLLPAGVWLWKRYKN